MTRGIGFFKNTLIGGILFLVPIVLLIVLVGRAFKIAQPPVAAVAHKIADWQVFGLVISEILTVVLLVLFCFLAGLISTTLLARRAVGTLEGAVLSKVPGYELVKSAAENMIGLENTQTHKVVLARIEDSWQIGVLVEEIDQDHAAIIVPNVPSPWSGSLYIMSRERFRPIDITVAEAIACLKRGGLGTRALLGGKMPQFAR